MSDSESIHKYPAVDVHGHYGDYDRDGLDAFHRNLYSGSGEVVAKRAKAVNVELTVVSPLLALMPRGRAVATEGNVEATEVVEQTDGLLQWVVIDPQDPTTYDQADEILKLPQCVGIKIHPEEHVYPIREYGDAIFKFAAERRATVLTHSGHENSLPADILPFADRYAEVNIILAHIGCSSGTDRTLQVAAIQESQNGNLYADTSSAMSIAPRLIEWAVSEIGPERVLFGTDTPLYSTSMQRARVDHAELPDEHKRMILRDNAYQLLGLESIDAQV